MNERRRCTTKYLPRRCARSGSDDSYACSECSTIPHFGFSFIRMYSPSLIESSMNSLDHSLVGRLIYAVTCYTFLRPFSMISYL
ncbi:hypothetical protein AR158_c408L [Paramecium bursaria Chlorella virus AR158]|uniref:hypothetical protein n=1 Tax=Paramecium bursaria Chlorella virus AR158 TaxID=380598 RepID=UPI00015AA6C0|nr:hypothetical protein AR158_c408L [Paramecium bursaria Chlorella virus AR158]ABU43953.1 hypothetical protein AR158_c408L [Paramecium bursaria Chlorella virus AR158]